MVRKLGKKLTKAEIRRIFVQRPDGTTQEVEVDKHGNILPVAAPEPPKTGTGGLRIEPGSTFGSGTSLTTTISPQAYSAQLAEAQKMIERTLEGIGYGATPRSNTSNPLDPRGLLDSKNQADPVFKSRLMSVMTDNRYDRRLKGRKRGKLDMHRLYKIDAGSVNLFTQKVERKGKQYNVLLVVDESGSMANSGKIQTAANTAEFLAQNFENKNLNIKLAVLGFNHNLPVHKNFEDTVKDYKNIKSQMVANAHGKGGGCNHDYDALEKAYSMFRGLTGSNLIIFISDGHPATCPADRELPNGANKDDIRILHRLVHSNEHTAATVGIGINTESKQIPVNIMAHNINELKPLIIDTLRKKIRRGV